MESYFLDQYLLDLFYPLFHFIFCSTQHIFFSITHSIIIKKKQFFILTKHLIHAVITTLLHTHALGAKRIVKTIKFYRSVKTNIHNFLNSQLIAYVRISKRKKLIYAYR